ncbi:MAG: phosphoribosylformylglycinamidine synthase subunit PurQ [Deltaproteobacteria bacterium]|nr:phosphoribosylformylglycinamidine synthase subunit PurQ [Deltaproteobacteria bacterium]
MKIGIVVFPGSNCDRDTYESLTQQLGAQAIYLWHKNHDLQDCEAIILPGGFSYGDYLRCGAIAHLAPIMQEVISFAKKGGPVLGICNGFQILTESQLLPGVLLPNAELKFICDQIWVRIENDQTPFTKQIKQGSTLKMPIAHRDGNYFIQAEELKRIEGEGQVVFRYCNQEGQSSEKDNPNGSLNQIAGVCNIKRNVVGLMPHPERACEKLLGSDEGKQLFESLLG